MSMGKTKDGGAAAAARSNTKEAKAAAEKATKYGDEMVSFTDKFYKDYIVPQLRTIQTEQAKGIARADQVFEQQQGLFRDRENTYQTMGKPAIGNFFKMVDEYNPEQEAQRRGIGVMGDITAQQANAQAQTARGLQARGVNPMSGQAIAAQGRNDMQAALVKAQEMNRLRNLTNAEGMQLKTQAANFGAGLGQQAAPMAGQSLQSGVIGGDIASQSTGALRSGAGIPLAGLEGAAGIQTNIYQGSKSAAASAQSAATQAAANDGGFGGIIGTVAGGLISKLPMFSDRRIKKDITVVGTRSDGINVYTFEYVWGGPRHVGYMADEVERLYPDAVFDVGGYKMVDYSKVEYLPW